MSIKGAFANSFGALVMYVIVIIITQTTTNVQYPLVYQTTNNLRQTPLTLVRKRFACNIHHWLRHHRRIRCHIHGTTENSSQRLFCAEAGFPQACGRMCVVHIKPFGIQHIWLTFVLTVLAPFRDLSKRRSMAALLVSFTIYTDTTYAISSVTNQLFVLEVMPGTLEISLYALASTISGVVCTVGFMAVRPYVPIRLEAWLLIGYGIMILIPVWGSIGLSASVVNFGFKVSLETKLNFTSGNSKTNSGLHLTFTDQGSVLGKVGILRPNFPHHICRSRE